MRPLRFLWLIDLDFRSRMHHGGTLRWFNLSRELLGRGHTVHFAINRTPSQELAGRRDYLQELTGEGVISGSVELDYSPPRPLRRLAHLLTHPALINACLKRYQGPVLAELRSAIEQREIDVCVLSDRTLLFAVSELRSRLPIVVDWVDSFTLQSRRQASLLLKNRCFRELPRAYRAIVMHYAQERYDTRRASRSLVVSPVDKACFDTVSGAPGKTQVLQNGVAPGPAVSVSVPEPMPHRLIFTGNMDFLPNHDAAVWFIDKVMPLVLAKRPEVCFVVAGRNPLPALLARDGGRVSIVGAVDDMGREIARSALYVAPLVSGSGFRNKVVESLTVGTYVIGTRLAVDFLPSSMRELLVTADTPEDFASAILAFLEAPNRFERASAKLREKVLENFSWGERAEEFLRLSRSLVERELSGAESERP